VNVRAGVVLPAGGRGRRMGGARKPFLELDGEPILLRALRPFLEHPCITSVVIALAPEDAADPPDWLATLDARVVLVEGGEERTDSVRQALQRIPADVEVVLIHDAARPLVSRALVDRTLACAAGGRACIAALPVTDTIKEVEEGGRIVATPDRRRLWRAQTPQAFPRALLVDAHERAAREGLKTTDDAALVCHFGATVVVVNGDPRNLKVTTAEDLLLAEALLRVAE